MFYPCLFCPSHNVWRAPDTLTRLGARTFLLISRLHFGLLKDYSGAPNDVQSCHLDKTNMDNSPMHRSWIVKMAKNKHVQHYFVTQVWQFIFVVTSLLQLLPVVRLATGRCVSIWKEKDHYFQNKTQRQKKGKEHKIIHMLLFLIPYSWAEAVCSYLIRGRYLGNKGEEIFGK